LDQVSLSRRFEARTSRQRFLAGISGLFSFMLRHTLYELAKVIHSEEGARFPISMVSSGVWAGELPLETAHNLKEVGEGGRAMREELQKIGYLGEMEASYKTMPLAVNSDSTGTCISPADDLSKGPFRASYRTRPSSRDLPAKNRYCQRRMSLICLPILP
jgi:hypothetical protein